jgi:DNA-binding protein H-NS
MARHPQGNPTAARVVSAFMDLSVADMDRLLPHLHSIRDEARKLHDEMFKREMARLDALAAKAAGVKKTRAKPSAKYRSRRDKKLTWSGRGSLPTWLREEMKGGRLKLNAFLIAKGK